MLRLIACGGALIAASHSWAAEQTCDPERAEAALEHAMSSGIVDALSMYNGIPTVAVDAGVWAAIDLETRLGIIGTFECAVAGSGNILAEVQVIDSQGKPLASFDGVNRRLELID